MKVFQLAFIVFALLFIACGEKKDSEISYDNDLNYNIFSDTSIAHIYDLGDKRKTSELLSYLKHDNPSYRKHASLQFASIQDSIFIEDLGLLLNDSSVEVRSSAVWALAQTKPAGQFSLLYDRFHLENDTIVQNNLLEAMGKTALEQDIPLLDSIVPTNEQYLGYAAGIYALKYRRMSSPTIITQATMIMDSTDNAQVKIYVSQFLSRCNREELWDYRNQIVRGAYHEKNIDVRIAYIKCLGQLGDGFVRKCIDDILENRNEVEIPIPVLVEVLRTYSKARGMNWRTLQDYVFHPNDNVALEAIKCIEGSTFRPKYNAALIDSFPNPSYRVKGEFVKACFNRAPDPSWRYYLMNEVPKIENSTDRAHYLRALGMDLSSADFLIEQFKSDSTIPAKTAALEALLEINSRNELPEGGFDEIFEMVMSSGDVGAIAMLCFDMRYSGQDNTHLKDSELFNQALSKLSLPVDMETYLEIEHTKAFLNDKEWEAPESEFNHPIDWEYVRGIPVDQKIKIETTKGDIILELDIESSPGSSSNFLRLIEDGFFEGKIWHRVVPNFVIQTGCTRGDGYGSVDFSIRSEFITHRYWSGAVGMASAGPDTESCQWFITHVPTPFLEGRYSIFAYVVEGMDVVNQISVGDQILSCSRL